MKKFLKGFEYAGKGVMEGFGGRNMKIHGIIGVSVILVGLAMGLERWEWVAVFLAIGLVMGAELFNSSIEELANVVRDENKLAYEATRKVRDLAAGAVLVAAIMAGIVGIVVLL
ncbi:MAG: diacylglycerol kinase family protein [Candidatus Shapirobacteria bacterium]|jgi:diacylglycerol kinase